jgi:cytochrome c551/c552
MTKRFNRSTLGALLCTSLPIGALAADDTMLGLAARSGCMACHQVEPGAKGPDGLAPIGPAWSTSPSSTPVFPAQSAP